MPIVFAAIVQRLPVPPSHLSQRLRFWLGVLALVVVADLLLRLYALIAGPIALRGMRPSNAVATRMIPVAEGETVPAAVERFLAEARGELEAIGFNQLAVMRGTSTAGYIALASDAAGVVATMLAMPTENDSLASLVGFKTQLASGVQVRTSNAAHESPWPARRGDDVMRLPEPDVARLHAMHKARVARHVAKGARIMPIAIPDPVGYQFAEESQALERAVSSGYFERDGSHMRHSWKGACLNAWRWSSPFKELRATSVDRKHRALLRQIGVHA